MCVCVWCVCVCACACVCVCVLVCMTRRIIQPSGKALPEPLLYDQFDYSPLLPSVFDSTGDPVLC